MIGRQWGRRWCDAEGPARRVEQLDCELTRAASEAVPIPVIASWGAGTFEHFAEVFDSGRADATLAASVFYFSVLLDLAGANAVALAHRKD